MINLLKILNIMKVFKIQNYQDYDSKYIRIWVFNKYFEFQYKKRNNDRHDAISLVEILIQDIELLKDGTWIPDNETRDASLDNLHKVLEYLKKLKDG